MYNYGSMGVQKGEVNGDMDIRITTCIIKLLLGLP